MSIFCPFEAGFRVKDLPRQDLPRLANHVLDMLRPAGAAVGVQGVYDNPLLDNEDGEATRRSWGL